MTAQTTTAAPLTFTAMTTLLPTAAAFRVDNSIEMLTCSCCPSTTSRTAKARYTAPTTSRTTSATRSIDTAAASETSSRGTRCSSPTTCRSASTCSRTPTRTPTSRGPASTSGSLPTFRCMMPRTCKHGGATDRVGGRVGRANFSGDEGGTYHACRGDSSDDGLALNSA